MGCWSASSGAILSRLSACPAPRARTCCAFSKCVSTTSCTASVLLTRSQGRQLVCHGHITVNGQKLDIPSYIAKPGDVIAVRDTHRNNEFFKVVAETLARKDIPSRLQLDARNMSGRVVTLPVRTDLDVNLSEQLIVEFYSR